MLKPPKCCPTCGKTLDQSKVAHVDVFNRLIIIDGVTYKREGNPKVFELLQLMFEAYPVPLKTPQIYTRLYGAYTEHEGTMSCVSTHMSLARKVMEGTGWSIRRAAMHTYVMDPSPEPPRRSYRGRYARRKRLPDRDLKV